MAKKKVSSWMRNVIVSYVKNNNGATVTETADYVLDVMKRDVPEDMRELIERDRALGNVSVLVRYYRVLKYRNSRLYI